MITFMELVIALLVIGALLVLAETILPGFFCSNLTENQNKLNFKEVK